MSPMGAINGCIARQQWRARIETLTQDFARLKIGIARQQWRARIETQLKIGQRLVCQHRPPAMAGAD